MSKILLKFDDGEERSFEALPEETLVQAALGVGIRLLTDCLEGACATCKAQCTAGEFELADPSFDALSAQDESDGAVLLCQMHALGDCVVRLPYGASLIDQTERMNTHATIVDVHHTDARTAVVTCEVAAPILFAAGQYAQLHLPGDRPARAFSFANAPGGRQLEFHVRLLESGVASEYFRERAKANDVVTLDAPLGYFYLRPGSGPVVMVAGGTGIAPFLSMLNHMHQHGTPTRDIHVLYGAATAEGLSGRRRLQTLQTELPQLTVDYFVDNDTDDEELRSGSVCTGLTPELFGRDVDVYLCGPPAMVETAEGMLQAFGVPDARTFTERFVPT